MPDFTYPPPSTFDQGRRPLKCDISGKVVDPALLPCIFVTKSQVLFFKGIVVFFPKYQFDLGFDGFYVASSMHYRKYSADDGFI